MRPLICAPLRQLVTCCFSIRVPCDIKWWRSLEPYTKLTHGVWFCTRQLNRSTPPSGLPLTQTWALLCSPGRRVGGKSSCFTAPCFEKCAVQCCALVLAACTLCCHTVCAEDHGHTDHDYHGHLQNETCGCAAMEDGWKIDCLNMVSKCSSLYASGTSLLLTSSGTVRSVLHLLTSVPSALLLLVLVPPTPPPLIGFHSNTDNSARGTCTPCG
jgi:hypothetical protein